MPTDFIFLFMIRVYPSPILFHFYSFIRYELVRVDPVRLLYLPFDNGFMLACEDYLKKH